MGKSVDKSFSPGDLRDLFAGDYVVRYLISQTSIHILRVWHGREKDKANQ
jgi:plasmid stabilization system protein ParE